MGKLLEVFPVQNAAKVKKPNALGSILVQPSRPGEGLCLEFAQISKGIKMCCASNCQRTWSRMIKSHCRESNPVLLRGSSAGLPLNLPRVTQGTPWLLGGLSTQWRKKCDLELQEENAEVPQECRAQGERLWREGGPLPALCRAWQGTPLELPKEQNQELSVEQAPVFLWGIKSDFGCCAMNFRERFCSQFGQGWGNRRFLYSLLNFCPAGSRTGGSSEILGRKTTAWYLRLWIQGIVFLLFKLILRDGSRDKELIWKLSSTLTSEAQTISCFAELQQTSSLTKAPQYLFSGQSKQFSTLYFKLQKIFLPFRLLCKLKARDTQVYI